MDEAALADNAAHQALSAFESCAKGDFGEAACIWIRAAEARTPSVESAVLTSANGAVGLLLTGDPSREVQNLLNRAEVEARALTEVSKQSLRVSSSGHQFRLAAKHVEAFASASLERSGRLRSLILRLIQTHRDVANCAPLADSLGDLRRAMSMCFGASAPEVRLLDASDDAEIRNCYALKADRLKALIAVSDGDVRGNDELLASALGLLVPKMLDVNRASTGGQS